MDFFVWSIALRVPSGYIFLLPNNATRAIMLITCIAEMPTLGKKIKRTRTTKKLLQGAISRKLEVHRVYISDIEDGKRNPTLSMI